MTGTLHKTEEGWKVKYKLVENRNWVGEILLDETDAKYCLPNDDGKEIKFKIKKDCPFNFTSRCSMDRCDCNSFAVFEVEDGLKTVLGPSKDNPPNMEKFRNPIPQLWPNIHDIDFGEVMLALSIRVSSVGYNSGDLSDVGNEIGIVLGKYIKNEDQLQDFITGLKHGISLTNGTH